MKPLIAQGQKASRPLRPRRKTQGQGQLSGKGRNPKNRRCERSTALKILNDYFIIGIKIIEKNNTNLVNKSGMNYRNVFHTSILYTRVINFVGHLLKGRILIFQGL